jgi:hexosaminidase
MSSLAPAQSFTNTLMPQPAHLTAATGTFPWNTSVTVGVTHFSDQRLNGALERSLEQLERKTGVPRQRAITSNAASTLTINVDGAGQAIQSIDEDESYSLAVTPAGIKLHAATVVGAMRGLTTLEQLIQPSGDGFVVPAVQIDDSPRFRWRGLMIDSGRHFEPVDVIKRNLDAMAAVKLNVFHWHLTEDQGFRIESKLYPKLTGMGSDGLFYTQDEARDIVAYARARGIRVVPEFDMPGHTRSWLVGYPELSSDPGPYTIRREFGVEGVAMDPTKDSTYQFIDAFIGEMATIFPDPYLHLGGDEAPGTQWKANARVMAFMKDHNFKNTEELQTYFSQKVLELAKKHNKHMVGWDEILNPALPTDAIIHSWRGAKSLSDAAQRGNQAILSKGYYLDHMDPAADHYLVDPLPATGLTPEQSKLVLGGEACMWGEHVNELSIDSRIWPRTAAVAERLWSPANTRDVDDMYRRLWVESLRIEALANTTHLTHEGAALRELAGTEDIDALRVFSSVLQPVPFGERYRFQHTSQLTPLDLLVDAVRPDPPSRYQIATLVRDLLKSPKANAEARIQLSHIFQSWTTAAPAVEAQMNHSPLLAASRPRAEQLAQLGKAGQQALDYLAGKKAPAGWKQSKLTEIENARKPQSLVRFTVLDPLHDLINAVQ